MQSRICAHLRHPTEAYRIDMGLDYSHPHTRDHGNRRIDETEIDLCVWLEWPLTAEAERHEEAK